MVYTYQHTGPLYPHTHCHQISLPKDLVKETELSGCGSCAMEEDPGQFQLAHDDEPEASQQGDEFAAFELPFKVATLKECEQRAYINSNGAAEWLFSRAHAFCQIAKDPGRYLRTNKAVIQSEIVMFEVADSQFHYRGVGTDTAVDACGVPAQDGWKDHTLESRALLVVLLAMNLLLHLVGEAFKMVDLSQPFMAMLIGQDGRMHSRELKFSAQTMCHTWGEFLRLCPGAAALWKRLTERCWLNRCISSSADSATFADIWFFVAYLYTHQKLKLLRQTLWLCLGKPFLVQLIWRTGNCLEEVALRASAEALSMLPALRTKTGFVRRLADPVNKLLLLFKLRKEKQHRRRVASTHDELGGATTRMVVFEAYLDCLLHLKALQVGFRESRQISVSWDPSSYGGKDILMAVVYDPVEDQAAYLMAQHMTQTLLSELHPSLLPTAKSRKLCRLEGYKEIKGLSSALGGIGLSLADFKVPNGLICRPLTADEFRLAAPDGTMWIKNIETNAIVPEIPQGLDLGTVACLVSISDQGPNIIGAANYLQYSSNAPMFLAVFDPYHRAWNDLKTALKRSKCTGWKTVLELTLVCNLNYGPFNSSTWHYKKKARLEEFVTTRSASDPMWQKYIHLICKERRIPEPTSHQESQDLFESLKNMDSINAKGPLVKLMRWFSFFESMAFYEGELWCTKMILEGSLEQNEEQGSDKEVEELPNQKDHRKELQELKKRKGTWNLAPQLINNKNMAAKDCIMSVCKSTWELFAGRARDIFTPAHVLEHNISCSHMGFWKHELIEMVIASLYDRRWQQHLLEEFKQHDKVLEWHVDLLDKLLETRAQSLAAFHCLPPLLYNHSLAPSDEAAHAACDLALLHWKKLLAAEEAELAGAQVKPLRTMHWRLNPFVRTLFMAYEQDKAKRNALTADSAAARLQRVIAKNMGDSRIIENIHQHGRDLFRASKANSISNTAIMANALRSKVLDQRKVPMVNADEAEKALGPAWAQSYKEGVVQSMKSKGKKMPLEMQRMMVGQKKGSHSWPAPAAGSLFQSVASTEWLFHYWDSNDETLKQVGVNDSFISFLARPGSILAQESTSSLVKVLASAEFGFLALHIHVVVADGGRCYCCSQKRADIQWRHIWDLNDWIEPQVEPCLVGGHIGPIGWKKTGSALPLEVAALVFGHPMTFQQALALLKLVDGTAGLPSQPSKQKVMEALIDTLVPEDLQEQARSHLKVKEEDEEQIFDSDFSEVISELAQDDGNAQDLKEYKKKKKYFHMKRKMNTGDGPIPKPKAKPKGKAKAKGKAKPKAKAKQSLGSKLLHRAKKKLAEAQEEKEAMEDQHEGDPPAAMDVDAAEPGEKVEESGGEGGEESGAVAGEVEESGEKAEEDVAMEDAEAEPPAPSQGLGAAEQPPAPRAERRRSPEEILSTIQPPGCHFGLSHQDHRFTSVWKGDHADLPAPYSQKRLSRTFVKVRNWREALIEVHEHNWKKWGMLKTKYPLSEGEREMRPGQIPESIFEQLKPRIDSLGEVVRYA